MMQLFLLTALLATLAVVQPAPSSTSCTISKNSDAASVVKSCTDITISGLTVPAGETLDLTKLQTGSKVTFKGKTTFEYKEWSGPLISVAGKDITVTGSSDNLIDGNGAKWWDGKGSNGGKTKPKFFFAHKLTGTSEITKLNLKNSPVQIFSVNNADGLVIQNVTIDNRDGDSGGGHNTDAFDVGDSNNIVIKHNTIYNQDDCLAVNSGTNIQFYDNYCSGGHGISIGSVGGRDNNVVKTVKISDSQIVNSENGVRIKTVYGATGSVSDITYQDITLKDITKYGIVIEGDYENGSPTGTPTGGVPITDLTLKNIKGTVSSSATDILILVQNAKSWSWSGIDVTGGKHSTKCTGIPSGSGAEC